MVIKVLAFATSPRRHGNSETLLDYLLEGMAGESGVAITRHVLGEDIVINPCKGCNACEVLNRCIQEDDDLNDVLEEIIEADCVVLASPIFCMGLCSQAKALVDRAQVFRSRKYVLLEPVVPPERKDKRIGIFVSVAGQKMEHVFDGAVMSMKCFFHVSDILNRNMRWLMVDGVDLKGEITTHPSAKDQAEAMGRSVIRELKELKGEV